MRQVYENKKNPHYEAEFLVPPGFPHAVITVGEDIEFYERPDQVGACDYKHNPPQAIVETLDCHLLVS